LTWRNSRRYTIKAVTIEPELQGLWDGPSWTSITPLEIAEFRPEGSDHRPVSHCKLQYSNLGLFGIFKVQDRYVRCVHTAFQSDVFKDSCVEIFLEPKPGRGYLNFEFNCGGSLLAFHVIDPTRTKSGFKDYAVLDSNDDSLIKRFHSLPVRIEPEDPAEQTWYLEFLIPFTVLEKYVGSMDEQKSWRANLYKCGDETSHPHWAAWSPIDELNFHAPENFGSLIFESPGDNSTSKH